jgi:hypothetical protein
MKVIHGMTHEDERRQMTREDLLRVERRAEKCRKQMFRTGNEENQDLTFWLYV